MAQNSAKTTELKPYTEVKLTYAEVAADKAAKKDARQKQIEKALAGTKKSFPIADQACIARAQTQYNLWRVHRIGRPPTNSHCYTSKTFDFLGLHNFVDVDDSVLPTKDSEGKNYATATTTTDPSECNHCESALLHPDAAQTVAPNNPQHLPPDETMQDKGWQKVQFMRSYRRPDGAHGTQYGPALETNAYVFDVTKTKTQYNGVDARSGNCQCLACYCSDLTMPDGIGGTAILDDNDNLHCDRKGPGWTMKSARHREYDLCKKGKKSFYADGTCYYCAYDNTGPTVNTNQNQSGNQPGGPNDPPGF